MKTTANLRKGNLLEILRVIRMHKRITRPEIAKKTKLTSVTVSTLITELVARNIVLEEGFADSRGGRKAVVYKFNNNAYNIIGVNLSLNRLTIDIYDLEGAKIAEGISTASHIGQTVENTVSIIVKGINTIIKDTKKKKSEIIGIGVLVPGRVDYDNGIVVYLPNISNWINIPLKNMIESEVGIPTLVERDTNSHILYLGLQGISDQYTNVVYCSFSEGIGAAVQIEGTVFRGDHGLAGEVGHTIIEPDGPLCSCGNHGCVESLASCRAIGNYYVEELEKNGRDTAEVLELINTLPEMEWAEQLAVRANEGDEAADRAFTIATKYLCICTHNIINSYDPEQIIIECKWMRIARKYFNQLVSSIFDSHSTMDRNDVKIILNPVDDIFAVATFAVVIESLMHSPVNNRLISAE